MKSLSNCITDHVKIDKASLDKILSNFKKIQIKKGDYFIKSGSICRKMAYIEAGYMRMFDIANGKEITFWIGHDGRFITSLSSFVFETTNFWNIQAITDCTLYVISRNSHFILNETIPKWLEFDNLLLANSFALLEKNMFAHLHTTAQERLELILKDEPELFLNVPHQYIASMIGITPESLSRLRKNITTSIS